MENNRRRHFDVVGWPCIQRSKGSPHVGEGSPPLKWSFSPQDSSTLSDLGSHGSQPQLTDST
ncbi:hypothetical protein PIB30_023997, partial [Stylosanthes scabra]|nr:hypothetical protein [Stylosanthes scabra]